MKISRSRWIKSTLFLVLFLLSSSEGEAQTSAGSVIEKGRFSTPHSSEANLEWIVTEKAFKAAYHQLHANELPPRKAPTINFKDYFVVIVFAEEKPSTGFEIELGAIQKDGTQLNIEIEEQKPQANQRQAQVLTQPYLILKIPKAPRSVKSLKLIEKNSNKVLATQTNQTSR